MQEIDEQVVLLVYKYVSGQELEEEEMAFLNGWLSESPRHQALLDDLMDEPKLESEVRALMKIDEDAALKKLQGKIALEKKKAGRLSGNILRYAAALVLVLALWAGIYSWNHRPQPAGLAQKGESNNRFKNDVAPGGDNALLQLADGSMMLPDNAANGILKYQDGTALQKKERGELIYQAPPANTASPERTLFYNTVTTPRKSRYRIVLPDGSKVWLNAASSLRFPVAFAGARREVELHGEAYFEVASLAAPSGGKIPFVVKILTPSGQAAGVEVKGTAFNINAYPDEAAISTTLLEGKVLLRVKNNPPAELLPGQQARLAKDGSVQLLNPDTDAIIAWKNNLFLFRDTDIETIMRMLSRWYDIDVVYEGKITQTFNGKISRDTPLSKLLTVLELTGDVYFTIEGKKITVKDRQ